MDVPSKKVPGKFMLVLTACEGREVKRKARHTRAYHIHKACQCTNRRENIRIEIYFMNMIQCLSVQWVKG